MDIHLTRDGVVVVSHDPGGARVCIRCTEDVFSD
jgi:glycerophosphoryl diester phosphodiesterase